VARGLRRASDFWGEAVRGLGATQWIFETLARQPQMPLDGGVRLERVEGAVALDGVRFRYPARPDVDALAGVDLRVRPGEVIALVGRSGAGKSTILNLLLRFYDPDEGRVSIDGHDARTLDPSWLRSQIGVVLQEPALFSGTIADNIRLGDASIDDRQVERAARAVRASAFIERMPDRYRSAVAERGATLSVGQKQLLSFARALAFDPRILVLDEATSSVDTETEIVIRDALHALMAGRTTIAIAHRLSTIQDMDKILVLHKGQVREVGTHQELLAQRGIYFKLFELQYQRTGT
jgi:ABC-type multidrug transport system fused ATPase/permease subunit